MADMIPEPGNRINELIYGAEAGFHPVTKMAIQRGSGALSIPEQARGHLRVIAHHHGVDVAMKVRADLEAFEAAGGGPVEMPAPYVNSEFARRRGENK
jgi:hypothetical protein